MGLWKRLRLIFNAKASRALDRAEDPRETLDYSYERQLDLLAKVNRGVADVATARKRLEMQIVDQQKAADKLSEQAGQALGAGREDLAREALLRRAAAQSQLNELGLQYQALDAEERRLTAAQSQLRGRVESFRTQKETIKATYSSAQAQVKIAEAVSGLSDEFGDVGLAIQRAQDKTHALQARAGAVGELLASGALHDPLSADDISRELESISARANVDQEMARLKRDLGVPAAPQAIEATDDEDSASEQR
jgi:phage shock protein A